MSDHIHPYAIEVQPVPGSDRSFQWTIRKHGKVFQRSDRRYPTEAKAQEQGLVVVEKLLTGGDERGF